MVWADNECECWHGYITFAVRAYIQDKTLTVSLATERAHSQFGLRARPVGIAHGNLTDWQVVLVYQEARIFSPASWIDRKFKTKVREVFISHPSVLDIWHLLMFWFGNQVVVCRSVTNAFEVEQLFGFKWTFSVFNNLCCPTCELLLYLCCTLDILLWRSLGVYGSTNKPGQTPCACFFVGK